MTIYKFLNYVFIGLIVISAYLVGESKGETSMGLYCMELMPKVEVQKSEIKRNKSASLKDDTEALYNLSLLTPNLKASPTPTPQKDNFNF